MEGQTMPRAKPGPQLCRRDAWATALLVALLSAACLPEGDPPVGHRLLEARNLIQVRFSPARDGAVLFSRKAGYRDRFGIGATPIAELWTLPSPTTPAVRLVEDVTWEFFLGADSLGRLIVEHHTEHNPSTGQFAHQLSIIEPGGGRTDLGQVVEASLSRARTRLYYQRKDGERVVRELDGRETPVGSFMAFSTGFAGETLLFIKDPDLWALPPSAAQPTLLVPDVESWTRSRAAELEIAALSRPRSMLPTEAPASLVLVRGTTSRLLARGFLGTPVLAPADDRLAVIERVDGSGAQRLRVFHRDSDAQETFDLSSSTAGTPFAGGSATFRPGTRDIWCFVSSGLRIVRADGSVMAVSGLPGELWPFDTAQSLDPQSDSSFRPDEAPPMFSADGRFWLYRSNTRLFLGRADQPELPGLLIQDRDDFPVANVREVVGGRRMLIWAAPPNDGNRWDLTLLDPETNQRRLLATTLGPSVIGQRRIVAMTNLAGGLGELHLIDLETGQDTRLAQNVTGFTVPTPCPACDATAPRTPVVYLVHARVPFKYDGLWRVELP
jgi:hypothetical protein